MHLQARGVSGVDGFHLSIQFIDIWYASYPSAAVSGATILTLVLVIQSLELCDYQVPS